jgi:4-hydroxythreonine-4-phosphate dehydrogenase
MKPLALTCGEPAGIGPELIIKIAQQALPRPLVVFADPTLLQQQAQALKLPCHIQTYQAAYPPTQHQPQHLVVAPVALGAANQPGKLNPANVPYVLQCLKLATEHCLAGHCHALVTNPVHKAVIHQTGIDFSGQTEYLQQLCQSPQTMMMLANATMRVALITTHLPLAQVAAHITPQRLQQKLTLLHQALHQQFNLPHPKILVCGLNPHAGENGVLGREEIEIIQPVIQQLAHAQMDIEGPYPADSIFLPKYLKKSDAIVAMYHDQGLPVLKYAGFGDSVNITLGLPIIRTSVDHGTALDIAGRNQADIGSLLSAINMACKLNGNRPHTT